MNKEDQSNLRKVQWAYYIKVNGTYYKKMAYQGPSGETALTLIATRATTIKEDLSSGALKMIPQYDGFANIPENDPDRYQRIVYAETDGIQSVLYNLYSPVSHRPAAGEWSNIDKVLRHLFIGDDYLRATLYLKNLYMHPTMRQPILCMVGMEQCTGKTTFLQLLKAVFNENMRILDSKRLSGNFNSHWAGKLIVATDEAFLDTEKKEVSNTLKMIATNDTVPMESKGKNAVEVSNFAKLIMCSNDDRLANKVSDLGGWICPVSTIPAGERDPHILDKIIAEIPAFLEHLINS